MTAAGRVFINIIVIIDVTTPEGPVASYLHLSYSTVGMIEVIVTSTGSYSHYSCKHKPLRMPDSDMTHKCT